MRKYKTSFVVIIFGFGIIFSSSTSLFLIDSQHDEEPSIDKSIDDIPSKDKPDPDKNKDNEFITASIRFNPHSLNFKSKGKMITAFIELPPEYNVENIDLSTVRLNGKISAEEKPTEINDFDNDNILDLMVKFDRSSLIALLKSQETCEVIVSGKLINQSEFKGVCDITYL